MRSGQSFLGPMAGVFAMVLLVGACGGSAGARLSTVGDAIDGGEQPAAPAAGAPTAAPAGAPQGGQNGQAPLKDDAKIVRTGTLELQVAELQPALTRAHDAVRALNGYVGASRESNDGDRSVAQVTYRIPSDRWDDALAALRAVGTKVLGQQTDALEVTGQLIDLGARIDNLRASEIALQGIAEKATKIADVLEVQARLTDVRGQIEQLSAQRAHLEDQAGYGTLTVTFGLQLVAVTEAAKGWNAGEEVDRATASLVGVLQSLASAGIWFGIVWLPILFMLLIVAAIAAFVLRRLGFLRREVVTPAG